MFATRRAAFAVPRQAPRRAWQPIARFYADNAAAAAEKPGNASEAPKANTTNGVTKTAKQNGSQPSAQPSPKSAGATPNIRASNNVYTSSGKQPHPANRTAQAPHQEIPHTSRQPSQPGQTIDQIQTVDWANSFYGISTRPVTKEQFKILMTPLDEKDIEVKPDGIIYLPEIKYRRRLNDAFGPMGWGLIPKGEPQVGQSIVTREYALIVDGR